MKSCHEQPMAMQKRKRVLLIGLRSDSVDYEKWPELSREKLEAAFAQVLNDLESEGFDPVWCLA